MLSEFAYHIEWQLMRNSRPGPTQATGPAFTQDRYGTRF